MRSGPPAVLVALAVLVLAPALPSAADDPPQFRLGFKLLSDQIPTIVGEPLEEEHHNPLNGDALQMTTSGLMVWRKSDNWTAFTTGWRSWVNGPLGLQERGNESRFPWEAAMSEVADESASRQRSAPSTTPTRPEGPMAASSPAGDPDREQELNGFPTSVGTRTVPGVGSSVSATSTLPSQPPATPSLTPDLGPTPRPGSVSPTATIRPRATAARPSPTPRVYPGGVLSPNPAGEWVTSISSRTNYYCPHDGSYWKSWAEQNRIWFATEAELLAVFPGRARR
jgi:hypothetical protein